MKFLKVLLLSVIFLTATFSSFALTGISYSNFARTSGNGLVTDQDISVTITILDGATIVYKETHAVHTNMFGLFTVKIGSGAPVSPYTVAMYNNYPASNTLNVKAEYNNIFVAVSPLLTSALKNEEAAGIVTLEDAYSNGNNIEIVAGLPIDLTGTGLIQSTASVSDINTNGNKTLTTKKYVDDAVAAIFPLKTLSVNQGLIMTPGPSYNGTLNQVAGIMDLGVTNAKIADGAVDNLKVNDNTEYLSVAAFGTGGITGVDAGSYSVTDGNRSLEFQGVGLTKVTRTGKRILIDGNDNWGTQVVVTDLTLKGNGTLALPLGFDLAHSNIWMADQLLNATMVQGNNLVSAENMANAKSLNGDVVNYDATLQVNANKLGLNLTHSNNWMADQLLNATMIQGNNLVAAENMATAKSLNGDVVNYDATLQVTGNKLGLDLNNPNSWLATQTFAAVDINGGTIDAATIGASVPADGSFTNVTVKDANGNTNFVIGASSSEDAGWAKLFTDAGKEIVVLGTTGTTPNRAGAVSVTDVNGWGSGLPIYGAGMFHDPVSNNWMVGAGKYDLSMGAAFLSDASATASVNVFNGALPGGVAFNANQDGNVFAAGSIKASKYLGGFTPGSVLFAAADGSITQNNSKLYWDDTYGYLGLSSSAPQAVLDIKASNPGDILMYLSGTNDANPDVVLDGGEIFIGGLNDGNYELWINGGDGILLDGGSNLAINGGNGILLAGGAKLKSNFGGIDPLVSNSAIIGIAADADYAGYFAGFTGTNKTALQIKNDARANLYITKDYLQHYLFDADTIHWSGLSVYNNSTGPAIQATSSDAAAPTVTIQNTNPLGVALELQGASNATTALEITTGNVNIANGQLIVSSNTGISGSEGNGPTLTLNNNGNGILNENAGAMQVIQGHIAVSYTQLKPTNNQDLTSGLSISDQSYTVFDIKSLGTNKFHLPVKAATGGNYGTIVYIINTGAGTIDMFDDLGNDIADVLTSTTATYIYTQGGWVRLN